MFSNQMAYAFSILCISSGMQTFRGHSVNDTDKNIILGPAVLVDRDLCGDAKAFHLMSDSIQFMESIQQLSFGPIQRSDLIVTYALPSSSVSSFLNHSKGKLPTVFSAGNVLLGQTTSTVLKYGKTGQCQALPNCRPSFMSYDT